MYANNQGIQYEFVYDLYASFGGVYIDDKIMVQEMTVPVSVNGIPWSDKETLANEAPGFNLREYFSMDQIENRKKGQIIKTEDCRGIKFSNALKMNDLTWIPMMHTVGEHTFPIIYILRRPYIHTGTSEYELRAYS